jgi:hypothetical protein
MSAPNGVCLHQILGELENLKKDIDLDITKARLMKHKEVWSALRFHRKRINHVIQNILNA